jgi:hypothetical protein
MQLLRSSTIMLLSVISAGCAAQVTPAGSLVTDNATVTSAHRTHLNNHMLIFTTTSGELRYWPIDKRGGRMSHLLGTLSGIAHPTAMAANADTVAIAVDSPPSIVLYDTSTGTQTSLPDSHGSPADVAFDKQGNIVALNGGNVVVYRAPQFTHTVLACDVLNAFSLYVATDREGDIFVNQLVNSNSSIIEIPKGPKGYEPHKCSQLPIQESGYAGGLLVDPATDALVVFHNPDLCAGGNEGVMDIYGKPYGQGTETSKNLRGNCANALRFGPDDEQVYFSDGSPTLVPRNGRPNSTGIHISQRTYPGGKGYAEYRSPDLAAGVATIPNELPN